MIQQHHLVLMQLLHITVVFMCKHFLTMLKPVGGHVVVVVVVVA